MGLKDQVRIEQSKVALLGTKHQPTTQQPTTELDPKPQTTLLIAAKLQYVGKRSNQTHYQKPLLTGEKLICTGNVTAAVSPLQGSYSPIDV